MCIYIYIYIYIYICVFRNVDSEGKSVIDESVVRGGRSGSEWGFPTPVNGGGEPGV